MTRRYLLVEVLLFAIVIIISLLVTWPVVAARRVEVDVILLVDTSASTSDELGALCRGIGDVVDDMDRRGVTMNVTLLGIAETRACADERVTDLIVEAQALGEEDWGPAVADVARHYEWTPGAVRLIIPLSDEGPLDGDPVDDEDEGAISVAGRAAQANEVIVSPLLGTDFNPEIQPLARELAQQTGGRVFVSKDPDDDLADGLRELVIKATAPARSAKSLLEAIPTPGDVVLDGRVLSANLIFAILTALVLGVASAVLDNTVDANRAAFRTTRLGLLIAAAVNMAQALERLLTPGDWSRLSARPRRLLTVLQLGLFLLLATFLGLFLQPGLAPFSWRGLGLWLGMLSALALVSLIYEGTQYGLMRRAGATPTWRLRPGAPPVTIVSVFLSRFFGFLPGFFYGRMTVCTVPSEAAESGLSLRQQARIALFSMVVIGVIGLSLWGLTLPTSLLQDWIEGLELSASLENVLIAIVGAFQGFFSLGFFFAWQTLFFELLPFSFTAGDATAGDAIYRRSHVMWAGLALVVLFVLLHTLVNPFGTADELFQSSGLVLLLLALFSYSALAVGLWFYFALGAGGEVIVSPETADDWGRSQRTTVMAISLIVIWVLGACWGLVTLVVGVLS